MKNEIFENFLSFIEYTKNETVLFVTNKFTRDTTFFKEEYLETNKAIEHYSFKEIENISDNLQEVANSFDLVIFLESIDSTLGEEVSTLLKNGGISNKRMYRIFNFSPELFEQSFNTPMSHIEMLNRRIILTALNSEFIYIKNKFGTDLEIKLNNKYGWIHSFGKATKEQVGVLPPSEVATYSNEINGILITDGAINANFNIPINPILGTNKIECNIENSIIKYLNCDFKVMDLLLNKYLQNPNANRIGEVGFGTNIGMKKFVPFISHINERYPSLHLGLGAHNQGSLVDWSSPLHLDLILHDCQIYFDDTLVLNNSTYNIDNLHPLAPLENVKIGYADTI